MLINLIKSFTLNSFSSASDNPAFLAFAIMINSRSSTSPESFACWFGSSSSTKKAVLRFCNNSGYKFLIGEIHFVQIVQPFFKAWERFPQSRVCLIHCPNKLQNDNCIQFAHVLFKCRHFDQVTNQVCPKFLFVKKEGQR